MVPKAIPKDKFPMMTNGPIGPKILQKMLQKGNEKVKEKAKIGRKASPRAKEKARAKAKVKESQCLMLMMGIRQENQRPKNNQDNLHTRIPGGKAIGLKNHGMATKTQKHRWVILRFSK